MISRNNITPKNSVPMILSGRDNILHPGLKTGIIAGDGNMVSDGENITIIGSSGNIIGGGCENVVLINSFNCEVATGLKNVILQNSSGTIVFESDVTYLSGAKLLPPPTSGDIETIYKASFDITPTQVGTLFSTPVHLLEVPPGYLVEVVSGFIKRFFTASPWSNPGAIFIRNGTQRHFDFGEVFGFPSAQNEFFSGEKRITNGSSQYTVGGDLYLTIESADPTGGTQALKVYITYRIVPE